MSKNETNGSDISLDIILPVTIVGSAVLCVAAGAMYYYCTLRPTVTSLDGVDFCYNYNYFPEE